MGEIELRLPFALGADARARLPGIGLAGAVYLAQLCLAEKVELGFPVTDNMLRDIQPVVEMLFDIRCWMDERPLLGGPRFLKSSNAKCEAPSAIPLVAGRSTLLWSGGKDSTLSALTLSDNCFDVRPLHVTANHGVEDQEEQAVGDLTNALGLVPETVQLSHPQFSEFSAAFARYWDDFPYSNRVPFGRDLLLAALATLHMCHHRAGVLSMGHDRECRNATVTWEGKTIPRNDIESWRGALALETFLRAHVLPGMRMLPPLARLSEYRILRDMLMGHPQLMGKIAFCFWGRACGRCAKCLRYYLAQRVVGVEVLQFQLNPLSLGACPELPELVAAEGPRSALFQTEVLYMLGRLAQRGDVMPQEEELARFAARRFHAIASELDGWEGELLAERADPQVPASFRNLSFSTAAAAGQLGADL